MKIVKTIFAVMVLLAGSKCFAAGQDPAETKTVDVTTVYCDLMESGPRRIKNAELYVRSGSANEIKRTLSESIIRKTDLPPSAFSENDTVTFVVFRGFFWNSGHTLKIDRIERAGNSFYVYAAYYDSARGLFTASMQTYPAAFISIGNLPKGKYEARLRVTRIVRDWKGGYIDTVQEKERGKERASIAFEVK